MLALILAVAVILISGQQATGAIAMTENEKHLAEARKRIEQFNAELEAVHLQEASQELANVDLRIEQNTEVRHKLRSETLSLWLTLINILDQRTDPEFDEKDVPAMLVEPPSVPGEVLRPGASPDKVADPKLRAEYEAAIQANRSKQRDHRLQIHLHRLNERIPPMAEAFIRDAYRQEQADRDEVRAAIGSKIENERRRGQLVTILEPKKR